MLIGLTKSVQMGVRRPYLLHKQIRRLLLKHVKYINNSFG